MGRQVRRVPPSWQHPKGKVPWERDGLGYLPMFDKTLAEAQADWDREYAMWKRGIHPDQVDAKAKGRVKGDGSEYNPLDYTYAKWTDKRPELDVNPDEYGNAWRPEYTEPATAFQYYEDTTEGTPKSPVFETAEGLAKWLVDNGEADTFDEAVKYVKENGYRPTFAGYIDPGNT